MSNLAFVVVGGMLLFVAGFVRWQASLKLFFVLVVFEGALRKWVFPEMQAAIYLAKDMLLVGVYAGFVMHGPRLWRPDFLLPWMLTSIVAALFGLLEVFNPGLPSLALGAVGWKTYFFYLPLCLLMPHLYPGLDEMKRGLARYMLLAGAGVVLAAAQFAAPADSPLNVVVAHEVGQVGEVPLFEELGLARISGTFPFVGGFAAYLTVMSALCLAFMSDVSSPVRTRAAASAVFAGCAAAMFMTGSRSPIVWLVAIGAIFVALMVFQRAMQWRTVLFLGVSSVFVAALLLAVFQDAVTAWLFRATVGSGDDTIAGRIEFLFIELDHMFEVGGLFGFGVGATHNAAGYLTGYSDAYAETVLSLAEGEPARVMVEMGPLGFAALYASRLAAIGTAFFVLRRSSHPFARALAAAVAALLFVLLPAQQAINPTFGSLSCGALGACLAAMYLARAVPRTAAPAQPHASTPYAVATARGFRS